MRIKERLKIIWKVLTAKNFAYFQYDRAEYWEVADTTIFKNFFTLISPNEEDDINLYFGHVILKSVKEYILEKQGENVGRTR